MCTNVKQTQISNFAVNILTWRQLGCSKGHETPLSNTSSFIQYVLVINGEKATLETPTFAQKRQRTLDMLIRSLYQDLVPDLHKVNPRPEWSLCISYPPQWHIEWPIAQEDIHSGE